MTSAFGCLSDSSFGNSTEAPVKAVLASLSGLLKAPFQAMVRQPPQAPRDLGSLASTMTPDRLDDLSQLQSLGPFGNFVSARDFLCEDERSESLHDFASWEDRLDALGSEPSLVDLKRLIDEAPTRRHSLYRYALCIYTEQLQEACVAWEDELDALGANPSTQDLEALLGRAPDPMQEIVIYTRGFLAQRQMME